MPKLDVVHLGFIPIHSDTKEIITTGRNIRQVYISESKARAALKMSYAGARYLKEGKVTLARVFMEDPSNV